MHSKYIKTPHSHGCEYNYEGITFFFSNKDFTISVSFSACNLVISKDHYIDRLDFHFSIEKAVKKKCKPGHVETGLGFSTSEGLTKEEAFSVLITAIEVLEEMFKTKFPPEMLSDMSKHYGIPFARKEELIKYINEGKCVEALAIAKQRPSDSLCFELGEYALENNRRALANLFYNSVPEYATEYREMALTRIAEINMQILGPLTKQKEETFVAQLQKAQITKDPDDSIVARKLLADLASIPMTTQAPFDASLNSSTMICELASRHSALIKENAAQKAQIAELQKQLASIQSLSNQRQ